MGKPSEFWVIVGERGEPAAGVRIVGKKSTQAEMNGTVECKVCGSKAVRQVSKAYDRHHSNPAKRFRALNVLLVVFDCILIGLQVQISLEYVFRRDTCNSMCFSSEMCSLDMFLLLCSQFSCTCPRWMESSHSVL